MKVDAQGSLRNLRGNNALTTAYGSPCSSSLGHNRIVEHQPATLNLRFRVPHPERPICPSSNKQWHGWMARQRIHRASVGNNEVPHGIHS